MREEKQTFVEMLIGIALSTIVIAIIEAVIAPNAGSYILGTIFGGCIAALILSLMYRSIEKSIEMDEESASKYTTKSVMFRLIIMCIALVAGGLLPGIKNVVAVLFGLMSLKASAYLQPFVHKVMALKN